jgi:hypothetical protein
LSRSGEATGNRNTGTREVADHLAEGCVLAPYVLYIMDAELIEGNYVLYQGDLSTKLCWEKLRALKLQERFRACVAWTCKISENADAQGPPAGLSYLTIDISLRPRRK